jgi:hemolysin III
MINQTRTEERLNTISHALGVILGIPGLILLILAEDGRSWSLFSVLIYEFSMILLFLASTLYHATEVH